jgi:hypothetical protein
MQTGQSHYASTGGEPPDQTHDENEDEKQRENPREPAWRAGPRIRCEVVPKVEVPKRRGIV